MNWIKKQFEDAFFTVVIGSLIAGFMPWMSGPYWIDVIGIFFSAYFFTALWIIARILWVSVFERKDRNSG